MYTGIVQETGRLVSIDHGDGYITATIRSSNDFLSGLNLGASVAVNGVCLSVTRTSDGLFAADITAATLAVTNLQNIIVGQIVNLERSAMSGGEIGGHLIAGHVDGVATINDVRAVGEGKVLVLQMDASILKYVFDRGFLAVNGASLTVASVDREQGCVALNLVPETLRQTTFSLARAGDRLNIEIEPNSRILVDTLERLLPPLIKDMGSGVRASPHSCRYRHDSAADLLSVGG